MQAGQDQQPRGQELALLVIGLGLGWLVGNSGSAVVSGVLTGLLGIVAGGFAAMQGAREAVPKSTQAMGFDARPLAVLVTGLALAGTLGLYVKSHMWLEPTEIREAIKRKAASGDVAALFADTTGRARFFGSDLTECDFLMQSAQNDEAFRAAFRESSFPAATLLADSEVETKTLIDLVRQLCLGR